MINLVLKDNCHTCLTDFPSDIANKSLSESSAAMLWKAKGRRRRASHPTAESSSEQGASEADIDSDSGYCSPKHSNNQPAAGALRNPDSGTISVCSITFISLSVYVSMSVSSAKTEVSVFTNNSCNNRMVKMDFVYFIINIKIFI